MSCLVTLLSFYCQAGTIKIYLKRSTKIDIFIAPLVIKFSHFLGLILPSIYSIKPLRLANQMFLKVAVHFPPGTRLREIFYYIFFFTLRVRAVIRHQNFSRRPPLQFTWRTTVDNFSVNVYWSKWNWQFSPKIKFNTGLYGALIGRDIPEPLVLKWFWLSRASR